MRALDVGQRGAVGPSELCRFAWRRQCVESIRDASENPILCFHEFFER